ncbi:MAG: UDP-N-acetylmuramoyl-tripeptide--D-alanyl-D-alanine ligase [Clostridiales bacterium]|nr:UDP-N-acetylmuramoyl-tripeptide--D-alanyl-D-alanine ligase [Clostridiales bacterium]
MKQFTLDEVISAIEGHPIYNCEEQVFATAVDIEGVTTDTRDMKPGEIFFAIKGENFDGHDYVEQALEAGVVAVVMSDRSKVPEKGISILVDDTVKALGMLAKHYRFKLDCKVIGITGSVGKTSVKEFISEVSATSFKVWKTPANLNNEIGLAKTILSAPSDASVLVLEMGMRGEGQIRYLTNIACPDIAVITGIGYSHIELLGSRENIGRAKMEITEGLRDGGVLVVNGDDPYLLEIAKKELSISHPLAAVSVDKEEDTDKMRNCMLFFRGTNIRQEDEGVSFDIEATLADRKYHREDFRLKVSGAHNIRNALIACLCHTVLNIGTASEFSEDDAREHLAKIRCALLSHEKKAGRGATYRTRDYIVINDAYNAAPESMESAFENFNDLLGAKRKICALGNMLELGKFAPELHRAVGEKCASYKFDKVFITGDNAEDFINGARNIDPQIDIIKCIDTEDVKNKLESFLTPGDAVLFKASHAFGFEALSEYFRAKGDA